jgi:hypothetical protein
MTRAQKNRATLVAALAGGPVLPLIGILAIAGGTGLAALANESGSPMSRPLLPARAPTHEVDSQDHRDSGHRCRVPARRRRGGSRGADEQSQPVGDPRGAGG